MNFHSLKSVVWSALPAFLPLFLSCSIGAAEIPDRPEKLKFPPLTYEPPRPQEHRLELKSGPVAYLVPSRELPLVQVVIHVRAGDYLDPEGKEGVGGMAGYLVSRGGTVSQSAEDLDERLAFLAANFSSSLSEARYTVSLNLLSKDLDEGFKILREALNQPRFQTNKLDLLKQQTIQGMKQRNDDSSDIEDRELTRLAYGEGFWLNRIPTQASVESVTQEDLHSFHKKWVHPRNMVAAVSGDFDREAMSRRLEELFAAWPYPGESAPPVPSTADFAKPGVYMVEKDVNQGRVAVLLPGIRRDNPDNFAVAVMNMVLGGGGFTSRIMNRVRSDEGLAYSAFSTFRGGTYYATPFHAGFQSKSATVAYASSIVMEEMKRIATEQVSQEEWETARRVFIDNLPQRFSTRAQVADAFADEEVTGRFATDPDYWRNYRSRIESVTREDVQRVAAKYLDLKRAVVLVVGQKAEILKGHPNHAVTLGSLVAGPLVDLPLRDPMTLKPMSVSPQPK
ncbi:MAG: insulinase family protein [Verrucomicrobia bacterium]|nr:insulinase family protein [Verrucomicrobiota bacterium]